MNAYAIYAAKRLLQFALVVFIGINLAFVITHSTPIDPVEQTVATATAYGSTSPEAVAMMRQSLRELYGLGGGLWSQYAVFWKRILVGDFGPFAVGLPDASLGPDQPRAAVDDRPPDSLDHSRVDTGKPARRSGRLLPR
jgi:peptide/nickel transport system permease protein